LHPEAVKQKQGGGISGVVLKYPNAEYTPANNRLTLKLILSRGGVNVAEGGIATPSHPVVAGLCVGILMKRKPVTGLNAIDVSCIVRVGYTNLVRQRHKTKENYKTNS